MCCRGAKIEAAAAAVATADDKEFAKEIYRDLVDKEKTLLGMRAIRDELLSGGRVPRLAPTPTPPVAGRFRQCIILIFLLPSCPSYNKMPTHLPAFTCGVSLCG